MKKKIYLFALIILFSGLSCVYASENMFANNSTSVGIKKGDFLIDLSLGGSYSFDGADETGVKSGAFVGTLRGMYAVNKSLYFGLEGILDAGNATGDPVPYGPGEYTGPYADVKMEDNGYNGYAILLAGQLNLNPDSNWRLYVPFGLGYMNRRQKTEYKVTPSALFPPHFDPFEEYTFDESEKLGDGITAYAGLGVEYAFSQYVALGIQARYQTFKSGGTFVNSVSLFANAGFRFNVYTFAQEL